MKFVQHFWTPRAGRRWLLRLATEIGLAGSPGSVPCASAASWKSRRDRAGRIAGGALVVDPFRAMALRDWLGTGRNDTRGWGRVARRFRLPDRGLSDRWHRPDSFL